MIFSIFNQILGSEILFEPLDNSYVLKKCGNEIFVNFSMEIEFQYLFQDFLSEASDTCKYRLKYGDLNKKENFFTEIINSIHLNFMNQIAYPVQDRDKRQISAIFGFISGIMIENVRQSFQTDNKVAGKKLI